MKMNRQISFKLALAFLFSILVGGPAQAQFDPVTISGVDWQTTPDFVRIGEDLHLEGNLKGERTSSPLKVFANTSFTNGSYISMYGNDGSYHSGSMVFATGLVTPGVPGSNPYGAGAFRFNGYNGTTGLGDGADFNSLFVITDEGYLGAGETNPGTSLHLHNFVDTTEIRINMDATQPGSLGRSWNLTSGAAGNFQLQTGAYVPIRTDILTPPSPFTVPETPLVAVNGLMHVRNPHNFGFAQGYGSLGEMSDPTININHHRLDVNGGMRLTSYNDPAKYFNVVHNETSTYLQSTGSIVLRAESGKVKVGGILEACEVDIQAFSYCWPDYVFEKDYDLMPLSELKTYVEENKHLPNIPSEKYLKENGVKLGEMQALTMEKVEELTLYLLEMQERMSNLETENAQLKTLVSDLTSNH